MAQPPPPDWSRHGEQELEVIFCGEEEQPGRLAMNELCRRHERELRARALGLCFGNADMADDAMQDLWVRLCEKRRQYSPHKGRWLRWANRLLLHLVVDLSRKRARFPQAPLASAGDDEGPRGDRLEGTPDLTPPPDQRLRLVQMRDAMKECLDHLSPEEREALTLQVVQGRKLREIAEQAGIPPGTAGTRVYHAREKMRTCLRRKGYEGGEV
jgi:RNA polymerase sigma-70 factor (ECF subfamily)